MLLQQSVDAFILLGFSLDYSARRYTRKNCCPNTQLLVALDAEAVDGAVLPSRAGNHALAITRWQSRAGNHALAITRWQRTTLNV
jgi:hypothetical protein